MSEDLEADRARLRDELAKARLELAVARADARACRGALVALVAEIDAGGIFSKSLEQARAVLSEKEIEWNR